MPMRRSGAAALAALAIAGCGGSGSDKPKPPPNTPKGAVEAVVAGIRGGDAKAVCDRLAADGGDLYRVIKLPNDELNEFGVTKDCETTLKKHGVEAKELVENGDPTEVISQQKDATTTGEDQAVVSSARGDWTVVAEPGSGGDVHWVVSAFPGQKLPGP